MTMVDTTVSNERDTLAREYLGKLLERHRLGASENDIRSAFPRLPGPHRHRRRREHFGSATVFRTAF